MDTVRLSRLVIHSMTLFIAMRESNKYVKTSSNGVLNQAIPTQIRFARRITYRQTSHFTGLQNVHIFWRFRLI